MLKGVENTNLNMLTVAVLVDSMGSYSCLSLHILYSEAITKRMGSNFSYLAPLDGFGLNPLLTMHC